ncbi:unnamed protein product (macronuclear) [Paramecium tetraurelia]|uniref:Uncharacterized protein n=1 Tax=Paramecium tetraurelia TaxID=5888 RepID=A0EGA2_PARTE|nr:uncharacterized protein GSPATT00026667001 [Paramecium tetraurelia]CAK94343.1 unnamed protein product [Paramecium tetraurelia]|eukprot:XP_001461716.1 hypothetical protein (macronuclear) [Paramecium tetraurelia strain d4-2]
MFKQQILESSIFQTIHHHLEEQLSVKSNKFIKLETEIEMIDMSLKQLQEQQSELLIKCLKQWIISEKYFKVIKVLDNVKHDNSRLLELLKLYDVFIIHQSENSVQFLYSNKFSQVIQKKEDFFVNQSQITYIFKFSSLGNINQQPDLFVNVMKLINCVYPLSTLTFKWIPYKHLNLLLDSQSQSYDINEVIMKLLDLFDIIQWKQIDYLELLSTVIPESDMLMYRSPQEFFDCALGKQNVYELYLDGKCVSFAKGQFQFNCICNQEFKQFLVLGKTRSRLLNVKDQMRIAELISNHCKSSRSMMVFVESEDETFDLEQFEQVCHQNPKLFRSQHFQVESQQNAILIDKITMLYLSMQDDLSNMFSQLSTEQHEVIYNSFRSALLNKFVIDKL